MYVSMCAVCAVHILYPQTPITTRTMVPWDFPARRRRLRARHPADPEQGQAYAKTFGTRACTGVLVNTTCTITPHATLSRVRFD